LIGHHALESALAHRRVRRGRTLPGTCFHEALREGSRIQPCSARHERARSLEGFERPLAALDSVFLRDALIDVAVEIELRTVDDDLAPAPLKAALPVRHRDRNRAAHRCEVGWFSWFASVGRGVGQHASVGEITGPAIVDRKEWAR
jgi:hypothetical protein